MSYHPKLADKLKEARLALGMTIPEVAKIAEKVGVEYITALEAGEVRRPAPFALHALAGIYVISYINLMELCEYLRPMPGKLEEKTP